MSKYHFIAIGGSAMHSLAIALKNNGHEISGSDDSIFDPSLTQLQKAGICPDQLGWFPDKINTNLDAVILGMHAKRTIPNFWLFKKWVYPFFPIQSLLLTMLEIKPEWLLQEVMAKRLFRQWFFMY